MRRYILSAQIVIVFVFKIVIVFAIVFVCTIVIVFPIVIVFTIVISLSSAVASVTTRYGGLADVGGYCSIVLEKPTSVIVYVAYPLLNLLYLSCIIMVRFAIKEINISFGKFLNSS